MPSASLIKEFEQLVGKENVFSSEADRQSYAYDAAVLKPMIPSLVVRPTEVEQLGQVVKRCYEEGIPMTVRGSGTNLTGGTIPDCSDTIVILTTGLNKILEINTEDLYATVQPGVITAKFAAAVAAKGLFYPPDPGSMSVSTIGGNVAESSGGLRGLKYGTTKDYVMGMEVFANTGDLVKTGSRTVKCATGYNIAPLLVGSEGTLAVTSKVTLKLIPPPKASKAMMALFKDMDGASQAVAGIIAAHVVPCTLEFLDHASINYIEDYVKIGLPRDAGAMAAHRGGRPPRAGRGRSRDRGKGAARQQRHGNRGRPRRRGKEPDLGSPPRGHSRAGPLPSHADAGRRHGAALQDPGHDQGPRRDRRPPQRHHRHLRPCR